jgi:hypothetical protein
LFWDRISICSQTWPQIWDPPCLAFQVLGFQVYVRHHSWLTIANFKCTQWYYSYVSIVTSLSWATYKAWEVDEVEVMVGWETSTLKIKNPTQPKQPPRVLVCDICRSLMTLLWSVSSYLPIHMDLAPASWSWLQCNMGWKDRKGSNAALHTFLFSFSINFIEMYLIYNKMNLVQVYSLTCFDECRYPCNHCSSPIKLWPQKFSLWCSFPVRFHT